MIISFSLWQHFLMEVVRLPQGKTTLQGDRLLLSYSTQ